MIFPYSTDVHDGTVRLAAIQIVGLCLLIHIFVSIDSLKIEKEVLETINTWQHGGLVQPSDTSGSRTDHLTQLEKMVDDYANRRVPESVKYLKSRIAEVRKKGLIYKLGLVLADFKLHSLFTSMFTHAGWLHLIGNMIFFYVCGVAMEQYWGYWRFIVIYLGCGLAAHAAFALSSLATNTFSSGVPLVGASGAIAGVMGAFVATHARVKVKLFYTFGFRGGVFAIPAYVYFGLWFLGQIVYALLDRNNAAGVAYTAHIGGFIAGGILGLLIKSEDAASVVDATLARKLDQQSSLREKTSMPAGFYYSPIPSDNAVEKTRRNDYPDENRSVSAEEAGWEALTTGNSQMATKYLSQAMNCYLHSPEQYRPQFIELLGKIIKQRSQLLFPQNEYYLWAKRFAVIREFRYAILCFDVAAFVEGNDHIRKNSLLEASRLRIHTGYQLDKVQRDMDYLLGIDRDGIAGNQARELLGQLRTTQNAF
jgi:membrane associated rhomboid family serine protease